MANGISDRRPISARSSSVSKRVSGLLVRWGILPNAISILSLIFSIVAGGCLLLTRYEGSLFLWWGAAIFILLRLLANMFDGMVAVESGKASPVGEIYNEIPDRISDVIIFICAGYASGSSEVLGFLCAILSLLIAYVRTLGNYMGVTKLFQGPMAKSHRMFTLIFLCVYYGSINEVLPLNSLMIWGLWIILLGSGITFGLRLKKIVYGVQK